MKNYLLLSTLVAIFCAACKEKKEPEQEPPISALSIIKGQLNGLDTSLYEIIKYETADAITDTAYLKREEARNIAAPFLTLPEIADKEYYKNYTEERLIDAQQGTLNITSTAKNENAEIQKQIMIITLADGSSGKVQSIFIDRYIPSKDSTIEQKLFWEIDKYFSIGSIIEKENQPEKTHFTKVAWQ
jgi:nitrous oxide reductase accessory protein NosL